MPNLLRRVALYPSTKYLPKKGLVLTNNSDSPLRVIFSKPFLAKNKPIRVCVSSSDDSVVFKLLDRNLKNSHSIASNQTCYLTETKKVYFFGATVPPHASTLVKSIDLSNCDDVIAPLNEHLSGDLLVIAPSYPGDDATAFAKELSDYQASGHTVDFAAVSPRHMQMASYSKKNSMSVVETGYNEIRTMLQTKRYPAIVIHSFDERIAQVLDGSDLSKTKLYLHVEGPDVFYRDNTVYSTPYFKRATTSSTDSPLNQQRDLAIRKYNSLPNVKWIFPSSAMKTECESILGITFNNAAVINPVGDEVIFSPRQTPHATVTRLCIVDSFDNQSWRGIDIAIRSILELSADKSFSKLAISIYGDGDYFDILTAPVRLFPNVTINKGSLSDKRRSEVYRENDLLLTPHRRTTRAYLTQLNEALASGITVISSANLGLEVLDSQLYICETEHFNDYTNVIKNLCKSGTKNGSNRVIEHDWASIINDDTSTSYPILTIKKQDKQPLLTIVVPSYNCERFLRNSVFSLINHPLAHMIEVIVVNDGSKDRTAEIARELETETGLVVRLIDKENGGHGSTINYGIAAARGKYFRLMDGDDYFITENFVTFLQTLQHTDSDIVLTDYVEDFAITATKNTPELYDFMQPGLEYDLEFMNYNGYGFWKWGPLLPTNTYKTSLLKSADFLLDEHCFYVDMEYNFITYAQARTVTYYPLSIYNYYLGRPGQSMSRESITRNYLHHEKVCLRLLEELKKRGELISDNKKKYLVDRLIIPMCKMQYMIVTEYFNDSAPFLSFDNKLKQYPEFYRNPEIAGRQIRLHRRTAGRHIFADQHVKRIASLVRRVRP